MATSAGSVGHIKEEPVKRIFLLVGIIAAVAGLRHLVLNYYLLNGDTGYDFRYLWLAGRIWVEGADPYGSAFSDTGRLLVPSGHVPELWAYPPSWWPIASLLGLFGIRTANSLWGLASIALCLASSFLIASAFRWAYSDDRIIGSRRHFLISMGLALPLLHFVGTSALEATTLVIALGQTSLLIYFGIALLLYGTASGGRPLSATGLSILFLKPQIGLAFAVLFLIYSGSSRRTLAWAVALSVLMALPALVINPNAPFAMIANMVSYDGVVRATLPQVTTGVRVASWYVTGGDPGGIVCAAVVALAVVVSTLMLRRLHEGEDERRVLWLCMTVAAAATIAFAPLHYYDFVIAACLLPAVLMSSVPFASAGILGAALILRADSLGKLTGLFDHDIKIFEGSLLSTVGGVLLLVAILGAASQVSFGGKLVAGSS